MMFCCFSQVLKQILRGDHRGGKPASTFTPEEERNIENQTIIMDPTIVQQRLHVNDKQEDKDPDPEHLDEDNSIMGIDDNPPLGNTTISKHFIALSPVRTFLVFATLNMVGFVYNGLSMFFIFYFFFFF